VTEEFDRRTVSPDRQNLGIAIRLGGPHWRLDRVPLHVPLRAGPFPPGVQARSRHYASDSTALKIVKPGHFPPKRVGETMKAMADTWFTSDSHSGHFNISRNCHRARLRPVVIARHSAKNGEVLKIVRANGEYSCQVPFYGKNFKLSRPIWDANDWRSPLW
jgi:hypothetical protein